MSPARPVARAASVAASVLLMSSLVGCGLLVNRSYPESSFQGEIAGLGAETVVHFDPLGVPHIFAQSEDDASLAIGLLHARSRLFQMELIRMASQGRLTQVLGQDLLDVDRRLRILTYRLDESVANLPEADLKRIQAYCDGINQGMGLFPTPLEFKLLKYEPLPWTPRDVVAVGRLQAWDLSGDAGKEAARDRVASMTDEALHSWLFAPSPHLGQPVTDPETVVDQRPRMREVPGPTEGTELVSAAAQAAAPTPEGERQWRDADQVRQVWAAVIEEYINGPLGGSNSWAISPEHTDGDYAILAADPHLDLGWPSTFYELHVHTPDVDYSGATFPGLPMVVIGRGTHVAWTLTTSYADAQDLFALKVNPDNDMQYELDGEWVDFEAWPQRFTWGDEPDAHSEQTYRISAFGPEYNRGREAKVAEGKTYALAWPGFDPVPLPMTTLYSALYHAQTPEQVIAAILKLPTPSQYWTFATDEGHIGFVLGGQLPDRRASALPRDGTTSQSAWSGYLADADRPTVVDPPSGFLLAPNQAAVADVERFNTYASGVYRATRIARALEQRDDWNPALSRAMQVDDVNMESVHLLPIMLDGLGQDPIAGVDAQTRQRLEAMVTTLREWNNHMATDSTSPTIYESWRGHLHQRLFEMYIPDEAARADYLTERISEAPMWLAMTDATYAHLWDNPSTAATETFETALRQALIDAEAELTAALGEKMDSWTWGSVHTLDLSHPFASKAILRPIFGADPLPVPGGRHTIFAMDHNGIVGDYKATSGPALRQVVAPGVEQGFIIAGGNAGQPKHPEAKNQLADWLVGIQHVAGGDEADIAAHASGTLRLKPAP